jgi:hypothetical protein
MYGYPNYGYQPSYAPQNYAQRAFQQQPIQTPQPQPQMPPTAQIQPSAPIDLPIQDIKFVNKAQAEAYILYPNTKIMLIDTENGVAYIKTADSMGLCKTDYFRFEKTNADGAPLKPQEPTQNINFDDFIKKDQIGSLGFATVEQYNALAQKLEQIQKRLEGAKPNVGQQKQP